MAELASKIKVLIVGGGRAGAFAMELFHNDPEIEIVGVVDTDKDAPGVKLAESLKIPVAASFHVFLTKKVDTIVNVTGDKTVAELLQKAKSPETEIMGGLSTKIMWYLFMERQKQLLDKDATLQQRTALLEAEINERHLAEEKLHSSLKEWRSTFDAISDSICLLDIEGRILKCNSAMEKFLGKRLDEIIGKNCFQIIHGQNEPPDICPIGRMIQTKRRESRVIEISGRWFEVTVDPLMDDKGNVIGVVHIISDVTERKIMELELEKKIKELEKFNRLAVDREFKMMELKVRIKQLEDEIRISKEKP
jgi:PAS domain S-box-containing protein